jgi:hypothetical protein
VVTVPSETKGKGRPAQSFGEPSIATGPGPGPGLVYDQGGDPPGVVTVPASTKGAHPTNHPGKPGDAKVGHSG